MADEMLGQESDEISGLEQIMQLAQSGDPQALPQIAEIAGAMLQAQQEEVQSMQPEQSFEEKLGAAKAAEGGK